MKVYVQDIAANPLAKGENSRHYRRILHPKPNSAFASRVMAYKSYLLREHNVFSISELSTKKKFEPKKIAQIQWAAKSFANFKGYN